MEDRCNQTKSQIGSNAPRVLGRIKQPRCENGMIGVIKHKTHLRHKDCSFPLKYNVQVPMTRGQEIQAGRKQIIGEFIVKHFYQI